MKIKVVPFAAVLGGSILGCLALPLQLQAQSNLTVRVLAANLSSGSNQRYETPGLNILTGLKPDVIALQEFNVGNSFGINTTAALSNMVATTFGPGLRLLSRVGLRDSQWHHQPLPDVYQRLLGGQRYGRE
ncbi:MAG: hypothetical protein V9H26_17940 [Verrucomicrobiota bacterium]